ncbi:hypothetical protein ElyMa_000436000 [Elysia marginata]|uniref:Uncharacterized protein n=1 Tax=Elysia marginata TaxID=1093978 RepID=A0AAV4FPN2_9GAST|nr:hypothetical protein ElyMa_000436000 [Elysia marginata]
MGSHSEPIRLHHRLPQDISPRQHNTTSPSSTARHQPTATHYNLTIEYRKTSVHGNAIRPHHRVPQDIYSRQCNMTSPSSNKTSGTARHQPTAKQYELTIKYRKTSAHGNAIRPRHRVPQDISPRQRDTTSPSSTERH